MAESRLERTSTEEIAELERLLAEKRQALAVEGKATEEREAFGETFRERYGEALTPAPPFSQSAVLPPAPPADELTRHTEALGGKERQEQLEHLIALAFSKGVHYAADVARHATPWLMDELHDTLADRYYRQLVESRQLKAL